MQNWQLKSVNGNNTFFSYSSAVISNLAGLDNLPMKQSAFIDFNIQARSGGHVLLLPLNKRLNFSHRKTAI